MRHESFETKDKAEIISPAILKNWKNLESSVNKIFSQNNQNAIDILLKISQQLKDHKNLHYTHCKDDKEKLREFYYSDLPHRIDFAAKKIVDNFILGQKQNLYRKDISKEMVERIYKKRILDLHNPKIFPPQKLNYQTIHKLMFEEIINSLSNNNGKRYLKKIRK